MAITNKYPIATLLASVLAIAGATQLLPHGKEQNSDCVIKLQEIHISNHEKIYNDRDALKIKVKTVCPKKQISTFVQTNMYEMINGKEHLVMPFKNSVKSTNKGSYVFYFKDIFRECLNSRPTTYVAHIRARIEMIDHSFRVLELKSKKSLPLKCSLY